MTSMLSVCVVVFLMWFSTVRFIGVNGKTLLAPSLIGYDSMNGVNKLNPPCRCSADQWTALVSIKFLRAKDRALVMSQDHIRVYRDFANNRHVDVNIEKGNRMIELVEQNLKYLLEQNDTLCYVFPIEEISLPVRCIPDTMKLHKQQSDGSIIWTYAEGHNKRMIEFQQVGMLDGGGNQLDICLPRREIEQDVTAIVEVEMSEVRPGIVDPSIFDIPASCSGMKPMETNSPGSDISSQLDS